MHILIADNETPARAELRSILKNLIPEATFYEAGDGARAATLVDQGAIDVVFLDIHMLEGPEGPATATLLARPQAPLLVLAIAPDEHRLSAAARQTLDTVVKPFDEEDVAQAVERVRTARQDPVVRKQKQAALHAHLAGSGATQPGTTQPDTMQPDATQPDATQPSVQANPPVASAAAGHEAPTLVQTAAAAGTESRRFGKYPVTRLLGRGGMAEVYAGIHPDLDRAVAIKVILPQYVDEESFEQRFRREARLVASLRHTHIVQIYDFDVVDGRPFMVMEHLDGGTLQERMRNQGRGGPAMAPAAIGRLLDPLAAALDYAHAQGVVHRDLKPANILFTAGGEPILTDFGIVKLLDGGTRLTMTGGLVGSPLYMSPEQAGGERVDARSDLYSLAVVLYELCTGQAPFGGESAMAVIAQHLNKAPPPPSSLNPALPAAVAAVLLKGLAKRPDDRFAGAGEFARAFGEALQGRSHHPKADAPTGAPAESRPAEGADSAGIPAGEVDRSEPKTSPAQPQRERRNQQFHVGGIQAGVVNQGGEQTFGDVTLNLDFGNQETQTPRPWTASEQAPAPPASAPPAELDALLNRLRNALGAGAPLGAAGVARFAALIATFAGQLQALPPEQVNERQVAWKRMRAFLIELSEPQPDPDMIEILGESLQRAVQPLALIDAGLPTLATRITTWAEVMADHPIPDPRSPANNHE